MLRPRLPAYSSCRDADIAGTKKERERDAREIDRYSSVGAAESALWRRAVVPRVRDAAPTAIPLFYCQSLTVASDILRLTDHLHLHLPAGSLGTVMHCIVAFCNSSSQCNRVWRKSFGPTRSVCVILTATRRATSRVDVMGRPIAVLLLTVPGAQKSQGVRPQDGVFRLYTDWIKETGQAA